MQKRWSFGFGTFFSLIVVYFIYLYSMDKGWHLLSFFSKWYLIIVGGLIALFLGIILLVIISSLLLLLFAFIKTKKFERRDKKYAGKNFIDAEYKLK